MICIRSWAASIMLLACVAALGTTSTAHAHLLLVLERVPEFGGVGSNAVVPMPGSNGEPANPSYIGLAVDQPGGTFAVAQHPTLSLQSWAKPNATQVLGRSLDAPIGRSLDEPSFSTRSPAAPQSGFAGRSVSHLLMPELDVGPIDRAFDGAERPTTTNPEPATVVSALVGLSLVGILKRGRRKRPTV